MPETFQALMVLVVALLPGALYVWAFERFAGAWGVRFSDRVLRFVEVSAVLHAVAAPLSYWLWAAYIRSGRLVEGDVHTRESATHKSYAAGYRKSRTFTSPSRWTLIRRRAHLIGPTGSQSREARVS
jgi:hypothetical protein